MQIRFFCKKAATAKFYKLISQIAPARERLTLLEKYPRIQFIAIKSSNLILFPFFKQFQIAR